MSRLEVDHPAVHAHFVKGGFSVQLGGNNPFGKIPVDQTIEETVNKDTQTAGGTKGFSLKTGAVTRYYLTSENRSQYLRQLRNMTGNESTGCFSHHDLQKPRIEKYRADVNAFVELMEKSWWKLPEYRIKLQDKQLFATCGETCYRLKKKDWKVVEELKSSHEEADTRMLLHANHASQNGYKTTVIVSEDTDVMILCLGHCKEINCAMYLKCGTHNRTRYINMSSLAELHER
ncbi:hypothetical protein SKAU_G00403730 [Synaphobranchus kaupii]|uniref:Uncharacterized protein n=1 Tax=Synaphobranchus kaupii TaxID=118154 RepID=A0A9Q1E9K2_SYNKA|nr:hypothetical protein SKAU_G00403730 [Synaphobranchus kaupii]